ncbi:unknown [Bacteroides sp. CAG:462]|nr:unknown [Bacteroides sp. CAG:462]
MTYADVLNNLMLMIAKFVKITIDFGEAYVLVKMVLQVFHRC